MRISTQRKGFIYNLVFDSFRKRRTTQKPVIRRYITTATTTTTTTSLHQSHKHIYYQPYTACSRMVSTSSNKDEKYTNKLINSKSPYLIQHAHNPVEWYEWGDEAFSLAQSKNKPIFLSIGYSACHWCHVMQHEVFENEDIAKYLNENFVSIKVDREERPDVDRVYMTFLALTNEGKGGWPLSAFLTPSLEPMVAATYIPSTNFRSICEKINAVWSTKPEELQESASNIVAQIREAVDTKFPSPSTSKSDRNGDGLLGLSNKYYEYWSIKFDIEHGGFGPAPKFPSPALTFHPLLRYAYYSKDDETRKDAIKMCSFTLRKIMRGGIHDHVGHGFSRYSVDREWHTPHFEKMLYDQAQLMSSALECALLVQPNSSERQELEAMAIDIFKYLDENLKCDRGGFYSAEDADSLPTKDDAEKKEGAFYVWTSEEIENILGEDAELFSTYFGVNKNGNVPAKDDIQGELTGKNILSIKCIVGEVEKKFGKSADEVKRIITSSLAKLKKYRDEKRPRPLLDDKIITAWNGLALSSLSRLISHPLKIDKVPAFGTVIQSSAYETAMKTCRFIKEEIWDAEEQQLCRSWRNGSKGPKGQCEDYAYLVQGLLDTYEVNGDYELLEFAQNIQAAQDRLFWEDKDGAYYSSPKGDCSILVRMKEVQDGAEPSSNSVSISNLFRLSYLLKDDANEYYNKAKRLTTYICETILNHSPHGAGTALFAARLGDNMKKFIITGRSNSATVQELSSVIKSNFIPNRVLINVSNRPKNKVGDDNDLSLTMPLISANESVGRLDTDAILVCQDGSCLAPISDVQTMQKKVFSSYVTKS